MIEVEIFEPESKPNLLTVISANIKFWIWANMHGSRFNGKTITLGFRKPLIEINESIRNDYYVKWEIRRNLKPGFGVKVPVLTISAYEIATNTDTSLIWQ